MLEGQITKALSGFYYVTTEQGQTYRTKARGLFRKEKLTPLVGDYVTFDLEEGQDGTILEVKDRKNLLVRPPIANIDLAFVISSAVDPKFSQQLLDRMLVVLESIHIQPAIYVSKLDLASQDLVQEIKALQDYYRALGYDFLCPEDGQVDQGQMKDIIGRKRVVFMGQSGVGKSRLLNQLNDQLNLLTGQTSKALGRGRHTTRHVELLPIFEGYIADTPGFSSLDLEGIEKEELGQYFPEFWARRAQCKFSGCLHYKEPKCAVKAGVESGDLSSNRYRHYVHFLEEIMARKPKY